MFAQVARGRSRAVWVAALVAAIVAVLLGLRPATALAEVASGTSGTINWVIDDDGTLTFTPEDGVEGTFGDEGSSYYNGYHPWTDNSSSIKKVVFEGLCHSGSSLNGMFSGCSEIRTIEGLTNLDTSAATDMQGMFNGCTRLQALDLSSFNTSNVADMSDMFRGCSGLRSLDVSSFDTSNVGTKTNEYYSYHNAGMRGMFSGCTGLSSLDLSTFDTSNVTDMGSMFSGCTRLASLNVSSFSTSNVTDMSSMFSGDTKLTSLDVSGFDTSNVTSMSDMFYNCSGLMQVDVSHFNTSKVTSMYRMFRGCSKVSQLDVTRFDTSNVRSMYGMFYGCSSLKNIDVSHFDTSVVTNMSNMFGDCDALTALDLSSFDTSRVTSAYDMFEWCPNLSTLDLSSFDTSAMSSMKYMFAGCYALRQVKLGKDFTFYGAQTSTQCTLPERNAQNNGRSICWSRRSGGSLYTPAKLAEQYDGNTMAGTWMPVVTDLQDAYITWTGTEKNPSVKVVVAGRTLVAGTDYTAKYQFYDTYSGSKKVRAVRVELTGIGKYSSSRYVYVDDITKHTTDLPDTLRNMYRLYNPNSGEHFYTANTSERDNLRNVGWKYEGVGWVAPTSSSTPVYRLYSGTDHHYTTSARERDNLRAVGWKYEGVGWYSDDNHGVPLYRQYNPNVNPKAKRNNSGSHNYTTDKAESDRLVKLGWRYEGIAWYGVKI